MITRRFQATRHRAQRAWVWILGPLCIGFAGGGVVGVARESRAESCGDGETWELEVKPANDAADTNAWPTRGELRTRHLVLRDESMDTVVIEYTSQ